MGGLKVSCQLTTDHQLFLVWWSILTIEKKTEFEFPTQVSDWEFKTNSDWSTVFREIKEINGSLLPKLAH